MKQFVHLIPSLLVNKSRLSCDHFGAFLANVKELNAHKQTKEKTDEVFDQENKDLYAIFEGLLLAMY
ncbi:hypothetical protein CMV_026302 [Castanea mollissima]|uniref:At4g15545-like C-terminal domain-containing protein n=1 Tax=Castanea mollissima TaxID=60419 RepID=A0A8J4QM92_9ROSI|nr:hypothetical protein CMV_026302 [Castanea mollissima]